jgi:hypothetical protein
VRRVSLTDAKVLQDLLENLRVENKAESLSELTKDVHFYPDFHGDTFFGLFTV